LRFELWGKYSVLLVYNVIIKDRESYTEYTQIEGESDRGSRRGKTEMQSRRETERHGACIERETESFPSRAFQHLMCLILVPLSLFFFLFHRMINHIV